VATLYGLATAGSPFQPTLSPAPNDWTVGITYTGCGLTGLEEGLAVDAAGNVWIANTNSSNVGTLCEFSPLGVPANSTGYTGGGLSEPYAVAIDTSGNVWVTNAIGGSDQNGSISEFSSSGSAISTGTYGYTGGDLSLPEGIAIDGSDNAWISNANPNQTTFIYDITEYNSSGSNYTNSPYSGAGLEDPYGVAVDTSGNVWFANGYGSISELSSSGAAVSGTNGYSGGDLNETENGSYGIAIDAAGNVWAATLPTGDTPASINEFNSSGAVISTDGYTGGGLEDPGSIAIDGAGNVWVSNILGNGLSEFSSNGTAISPSNGYLDGGFYSAPPVSNGIAIDGSGNIWISDSFQEYLTEVVGAAAPVVTPIVANLKSPYGTHAVNEP
jgi:streptogramin lyase